MELVERYLQAVKFWLPKPQKDDIIAELSDEIHAQIEESETLHRRRLNEIEVGDILQKMGRPVLVANRYLPQQHLIGPMLFPIYRFVVKIVILCYFVPWLIAATTLLAANPGYQTLHTLGSLLSTLWSTAFLSLGVVTIVFASLERVQQANSQFLEAWDPRKLPPLRHFNLIKRSSASFELAANLFCAIWWPLNMWSPIVLNHPAVRITLSPLWPYFFWGYLFTSIALTALSAANLLRPYWTGTRASIRLLIDCFGGVLFCWLLKANIVAEIVARDVPLDKTARLTDAINIWAARLEPWAILVVLIIAGTDVFRLVRLKTNGLDRFNTAHLRPSGT